MPPRDDIERIPVIIATTMATQQWDIDLPMDIVVQALIARLVEAPELPFTAQDGQGAAIPYRLMWKERGRYLSESETLREAGVQPGNTLVVTHEARAGVAVTLTASAR